MVSLHSDKTVTRTEMEGGAHEVASLAEKLLAIDGWWGKENKLSL